MKRLCIYVLLCLLLASCTREPPTTCAEGHTPGEWEVLLTPTEDAEGLRHRACTVCGVTTESERIPRLSDPESPEPNTTPTPDTPEAESPAPSTPEQTAPLSFSELGNGTLGVKIADKTLTRVEIPALHEGKAVTALLPRGFADCTVLTAVTLPEGITAIGAECFAGCTALSELTLPTTLREVGAGAFSDCNALPIRETQNARYLGSIFLGPTHTNVEHFAPIAGTTVLCDDAFSACTALETLLLPTSLCGIGNALTDHPSLTSVFTDITHAEWETVTGTLPQGVTLYATEEWRFVQGLPKPY